MHKRQGLKKGIFVGKLQPLSDLEKDYKFHLTERNSMKGAGLQLQKIPLIDYN